MTQNAYFTEKIKEIDEQISRLKRQQDFYARLIRACPDGNTILGDIIIRNPKSQEKYLTLICVSQVLAQTDRGLSTEALLRYLRRAHHDTRNANTIKSHLGRLRDEGLLQRDLSSGKWTMP